MPLTKANGNMYPWVTHVHSHLRGACPHACPYCYVQAIDKRFKCDHHQGPVRLVERELAVRYGSGRTIFVEHTNDLFAEGVPAEWVWKIFEHMMEWPENWYVLQTKNPEGALGRMYGHRPSQWMLGVTVESDRTHVGNTPHPLKRLEACRRMADRGEPVFITIEPVLAFSPSFAYLVATAKPTWVNIGADSKRTPGLPQPTRAEADALVADLTAWGVEVRQKTNLEVLR